MRLTLRRTRKSTEITTDPGGVLKIFLLLIDHYTYFHYNSNVGISIYSPIRWILSKWNGMPLEMQLDHQLGAQYRTLFRRADDCLASEGLTTFTKILQLCFNILFSFLAVILVTRGNPYPLMSGYAVCLVAILFVVNRTVPHNMAQISKRFWQLQRTLDDKVSLSLSRARRPKRATGKRLIPLPASCVALRRAALDRVSAR